ncbi:threonine-phosphate decarboxylase [Coraliomargarita algicola]|uniref:Threonine-phosphate decarboxylase n=1 Tax=Coraliomargarita algicola TaxID=3092156 RepID=A0ABZ0RGF7_9BACT|nr:threonine-phosphate decarboxylase [Coraliomargarita sp. J2-16]WPJ94608.1 threonine-phosphate decarboxylase [Coraliomargarita sp. J2-16]
MKSSTDSHQHGGAPRALFARYGLPEREVLDLSVNLNPFGVPELIRQAWPDWIDQLAPYPSVEGLGVKAFYQQSFQLPNDCVLPGNGSLELMYFVQRVRGYRRVGVVLPSFHDYMRSVTAADVDCVPLLRDCKQSLDTFINSVSLRQALESLDAIYIGSPNNPDGNVASAEDLLRLAAAFPQVDFLVDHAFIQFIQNAGHYSLLSSERLRDNIIVFHSLTKFYALAGVRLGALVSSADTIARLSVKREPWAVNAVAESCAALLPRCTEYVQHTQRWLSVAGAALDAELTQIAGLFVYPSQTNYRLICLRQPDYYDAFLQGLLQQGIHPRCCRNFVGLPAGHIRVCVGLEAENQRLVAALRHVMKGLP